MFKWQIGRCELEVQFWFAATVTVLILLSPAFAGALLAAGCHELGHLASMRACACMPEKIVLHAFGVDIEDRKSTGSYFRDALISLAGPAANLLLFLCCLPFASFQSPVLQSFFAANGALAAFHLLPIAPLDGGQALFALLSRRLPTERAGTVVWAFSLLILLPLAVLGFWVLLQSRYNFSLLAVSVYLMFLLVFKRGRFF